MPVLRHPIMPAHPLYYNRQTNAITTLKESSGQELDLKEICIFLATGFFLGDATYYSSVKALPPGTDYELNERYIVSQKPYWQWAYEPRDITLTQAVEEYASVLESTVAKLTSGRKVLLALSGGLDSRTLAAGCHSYENVHGYSYAFANSFPEAKYGEAISKACGFPFHKYIIPKGYLWDKIEEMAQLNDASSEFTHPRQMAVVDEVKKYGDLFLLGHWGDVLFDDMGVEDDISLEEQISATLKKIVKKGGAELAGATWQAWGLQGNFEEYLTERISALLQEIDIEKANARIRAFKTRHWAYRWTNSGLVYFSSRLPVALPYYTDEMCRLISSIPERHLAGRQIQIEYLRAKSPKLASIPWQSVDPLNLYSYKKFHSLQMLPVRALKKVARMVNHKLLKKNQVQRNWEIQFVGAENEKKLEEYLFENKQFSELIPSPLVQEFYRKFREQDPVFFSHAVSMLLTVSLFTKQRTLNT